VYFIEKASTADLLKAVALARACGFLREMTLLFFP
jgi:hypothetical protein